MQLQWTHTLYVVRIGLYRKFMHGMNASECIMFHFVSIANKCACHTNWHHNLEGTAFEIWKHISLLLSMCVCVKQNQYYAHASLALSYVNLNIFTHSLWRCICMSVLCEYFCFNRSAWQTRTWFVYSMWLIVIIRTHPSMDYANFLCTNNKSCLCVILLLVLPSYSFTSFTFLVFDDSSRVRSGMKLIVWQTLSMIAASIGWAMGECRGPRTYEQHLVDVLASRTV